MAIVYIHRRRDIEDPFSNVFYVGISINTKRPYEKYKRSNYWKSIVNKHGYLVEITHSDILWEEACAIERYLIFFYGRHDLGLGDLSNMTDGGDGVVNYIRTEEQNKAHGLKISGKNNPMYGKSAQTGKRGFNTGKTHSEETKRKISESVNKRGYKHSEEVRKIISDKLKGKKPYKGDHPCLGKPMSDYTKRKLYEANKGRKATLEQRQNMSIQRKGRKMSEESKKRMSDAKKLYWQLKKEFINQLNK